MSNQNRRELLQSLFQATGAVVASAVVPQLLAKDPASAREEDLAKRVENINGDVEEQTQSEEEFEPVRWFNAGWRNGGGGWRNGGWRNGGWRNYPWRNGGWRNYPWRNGGWRNGWRNW